MHGYDIQDYLEKLLAQKDPDVEKIKKIVLEECQRSDGYIFSGFISVYAEAIVWLGEKGVLQITNDNGGRVVEARREAAERVEKLKPINRRKCIFCKSKNIWRNFIGKIWYCADCKKEFD